MRHVRVLALLNDIHYNRSNRQSRQCPQRSPPNLFRDAVSRPPIHALPPHRSNQTPTRDLHAGPAVRIPANVCPPGAPLATPAHTTTVSTPSARMPSLTSAAAAALAACLAALCALGPAAAELLGGSCGPGTVFLAGIQCGTGEDAPVMLSCVAPPARDGRCTRSEQADLVELCTVAAGHSATAVAAPGITGAQPPHPHTEALCGLLSVPPRLQHEWPAAGHMLRRKPASHA